MARAPTEIRSLARQYTEDAIKTLVEIMKSGANETARANCAQALLDRGWGKATQILAGDEDGGPITITWQKNAAS